MMMTAKTVYSQNNAAAKRGFITTGKNKEIIHRRKEVSY